MKTSWESSAKWYDESVGKQGHYYHEQVILPQLLPLMQLNKGDKLLDLGCGQGILARAIPQEVDYVGVDISPSLIEQAKKHTPQRHFYVQDVTKPLKLKEAPFTHGAIILALQNIEDPLAVLKNFSKNLQKGGKLFLVLNHPYFRIPRQTHWETDKSKKLMYRRIDSYMSPQKIPIQTHPGKNAKITTWSFHTPLFSLINNLHLAGFSVIGMEEWVSNKKSEGGAAKMENRARDEFPLFMTIICQK